MQRPVGLCITCRQVKTLTNAGQRQCSPCYKREQKVKRAGFPPGPFSVIYADPPWAYSDQKCNGGVGAHYPTMRYDQIARLPVDHIASRDAVLFLWTTYPFLAEGLDLIEKWGFTYKSIAFQWVKARGEKAFVGLGRWTRGNTEPCLLATRGKPHRQAQSGPSASVRQLVFEEQTLISPVGKHSAKPIEVRDRIVQLMGDIPRIELFARERAPGWESWGNQCPTRLPFAETGT